MADELKLRISADTGEAQIEIKQLQAAMMQLKAEKLGAQFIGDKQAADQFTHALKAMNVTMADLKAQKALSELGKEAQQSSKIAKEAFATASSEIIESWGVDGDIANEIGKMFTALPATTKVALVAVAGAFVAGAAAVGIMVAATSQMLDVAEKVGTKSRDDFNEFAKAAKAAGVTITEADRALSQDLLRSMDAVKATADGLFVTLIRESGPELVALLKQTTQFLHDLEPAAQAFGHFLREAFLLGAAGEKTLLEGLHLIALAINNPMMMGGIAMNLLFEQFKANYEELQNKISEYKPPTATFDSEGKGSDRKAAREQLERELDRIRIRNAQVTTESYKENETLRAATEGYIKSLQGKIELFKGFVALTDGQSKEFTKGVQLALEASKELLAIQTRASEVELQRLSTFYGNEVVIAQARAELERQNEIARYDAAKREIETNIQNNQGKLEAQRLYFAQLEELEKEHQAVLANIQRGEQLTNERAKPTSARSLFGDAFADELQKSQNRLRAFAVSARESFAQASAAAGNLGTMGARAFGQFAAGLGEVIKAFILTEQTGPAALRKLTAAVLAEVAQQAAVKAIFELAEGFAALALGDPRAALHFQAAGLYGGVAAVSGALGAAIAPNSSAASGGALGNSLTSGSNQSTETRYRYNERDGSGAIASNIIVTIKTDQAQQIANVERAALTSYRQNGAMKAIADNALSGIPITTG